MTRKFDLVLEAKDSECISVVGTGWEGMVDQLDLSFPRGQWGLAQALLLMTMAMVLILDLLLELLPSLPSLPLLLLLKSTCAFLY